MSIAFLLTHSYENEHGENTKVIGIFSNRLIAEKSIERLQNLPGFIDHRDGFYIDLYTLDSVNWTEGFIVEK